MYPYNRLFITDVHTQLEALPYCLYESLIPTII
jgi:hypothetical protein